MLIMLLNFGDEGREGRHLSSADACLLLGG
jgi:hypothetical protein